MGIFAEILAIVIMVFLFYGTPDPYDRIHDWVMDEEKTEKWINQGVPPSWEKE